MKFIFLLIFACFIPLTVPTSNLTQKIQWLYNRLQKKLWTHDQQFLSPKHPAHIKGLYQSHIKINFIDKKNSYFSTLMRKNSLDDNNMFVTSFVLYGLLQASQLETIQLSHHDFSIALEAISGFRDKNTEYGVPQYNFWPQNLVNGTWIAQPSNLLNVANMIPNASNLPKPVLILMQRLGLDIVFAMKDLVNVFTIPADNDDSSVNLALLGMLKQTKSVHFPFWKSVNFKVEDYYKRVLKYAYRPFDGNFNDNKFANEIDPRVYQIRNQTATVILPTTWLINYQEQINGQIRMPFSNNNVDATVCANLLFGISSLALNNELNIEKVPDLKQLIINTAELLEYIITNKIDVRPDLALVYYPSKYDFFWFVGRILNLYKRHPNLQYPFSIAYQKLSQSMKNQGTNIIIKNAQKTKIQSEKYWSQFLGNYANKIRNQDSIFSTSLALNALLDTWTVRNGKNIKYDSDIPPKVHNIIEEGINYLNRNLKPNMKESNAFFSGSWKSDQTNPYIYPANVHLDKNKKNIDPTKSTFNDIKTGMNYLMKGFIQTEKYKQYLNKKWFGYDVPTQFKGFNQQPFPFWSAQPITEVMAITAISKFIKSEQSLLNN